MFEAPHPGGRALQPGRTLLHCGISEKRPQELPGDAEGQVLFKLGSAGAHHADLAPPRGVKRCLEELRLSHPGVADQQEGLAGPGARRRERVVDRSQDAITLEQLMAARGPVLSADGRRRYRHRGKYMSKSAPVRLNPRVDAWGEDLGVRVIISA
jgi:hypothetical protein